jgi:hypothetical protein
VLFLVLVPVAMALLWKIEEIILSSVFGLDRECTNLSIQACIQRFLRYLPRSAVPDEPASAPLNRFYGYSK